MLSIQSDNWFDINSWINNLGENIAIELFLTTAVFIESQCYQSIRDTVNDDVVDADDYSFNKNYRWY